MTPPAPEAEPYLELYREALAIRALAGGHVTTLVGRRSVSDAELILYIGSVLDRRPDARCTQEREVAVWLNRMVVAEERWHRTWQRTVCARLQAAARAKLPPGPIPVLWLP
jgi:hypothetical protein